MSPPIALSPVAEAIISTAPPDVMPEPLRSVTLPPDSALLEPAEISTEPPALDDPVLAHLLDRKDVVLAPHAGAASKGAMQAMAKMAAQNILDFFDGNLTPECTFNHKALESK